MSESLAFAAEAEDRSPGFEAHSCIGVGVAPPRWWREAGHSDEGRGGYWGGSYRRHSRVPDAYDAEEVEADVDGGDDAGLEGSSVVVAAVVAAVGASASDDRSRFGPEARPGPDKRADTVESGAARGRSRRRCSESGLHWPD